MEVSNVTQLGASPYTALDQIPIGRRIRELMAEKGNYYSLAAMSKRLGTNRETFRSMLNGQREIYKFELEKIATDLKITVARIMQTDCTEIGNRLKELLNKQSFPEEALDLSLQLLATSKGVTERCYARLRVGLAQFFNKSYEHAYDSLIEAYQQAVYIEKEYGDTDLYSLVLNALMDVYTALGNYLDASKILREVETVFQENPTRRAAICYQHAKIRESTKDIQGAKKFAYQSVDHAMQANKRTLIGKTKVNAAHYEYLTQNYEQAQELLEQAIDDLDEDVFSQQIAKKELVKTLIKLNRNQAAAVWIQSTLSSLTDQRSTPMRGKLLVLLSRALDEPTHAQLVFQDEEYSKNVRYVACRYLMHHFRDKGDSTKFIYYYERGEELSSSSMDILDEGAL